MDGIIHGVSSTTVLPDAYHAAGHPAHSAQLNIQMTAALTNRLQVHGDPEENHEDNRRVHEAAAGTGSPLVLSNQTGEGAAG